MFFISKSLLAKSKKIDAKVLVKPINNINTNQKGNILTLDGGFGEVWGLPYAKYGEWVIIAAKQERVLIDGMVIGIDSNICMVAILGDYTLCAIGDIVKKTDQLIGLEFNIKKTLGKVINAVGDYLITDAIDSAPGPVIRLDLEVNAPGIIDRKGVNVPIQTGILGIDSMIPLGRGQRELIIGDKQTGKTTIAIDTILNQKFTMVSNIGAICIYVSIGQRTSSVARIHDILKKKASMKYSIIVSTVAHDTASLQYLAPYTGCVIGEWFRDMGEDSLIIYDDLSKHSVAYRQMSLLLKRPACRDAYPADIFYIHSRLLERASQMSEDLLGGSLTALPIVETQLGDVAAYIPTNLISITDGQIFLDSEIFNSGQKPALNIGLSISRVGSAAQVPIFKGISSTFKKELSQFTETKHLLNFEGDLSESSLKILIRGLCIYRALYQFKHNVFSVTKQIFLIYIIIMGYLDYLNVTVKAHIYDSIDRFFCIENPSLVDYKCYNFKPLHFFCNYMLHKI